MTKAEILSYLRQGLQFETGGGGTDYGQTYGFRLKLYYTGQEPQAFERYFMEETFVGGQKVQGGEETEALNEAEFWAYVEGPHFGNFGNYRHSRLEALGQGLRDNMRYQMLGFLRDKGDYVYQIESPNSSFKLYPNPEDPWKPLVELLQGGEAPEDAQNPIRDLATWLRQYPHLSDWFWLALHEGIKKSRS